MRYVALFLLGLGLICPARAQEPDVEAKAQACLSKLLETTQRELDVRAQAIVWQRDMNAAQVKLDAAQKRVKALEDKYEPKKSEEK